MSRLPAFSGAELVKALGKAGFSVLRQKAVMSRWKRTRRTAIGAEAMWPDARRPGQTPVRSSSRKRFSLLLAESLHLSRTTKLFALLFLATGVALAGESKPVPRWQALPLPSGQVSFTRDGVELARHYGADGQRPFVYPIIGPSGRSLTRMGHPHDPESHSHHNSVWLSHQNVNALNFWEDRRGTRIEQQRILRLEDGETEAFVETENLWLDAGGAEVLRERRRTGVQALEHGEWLLLIDSELVARKAPVTLGETAFGMLGVRMAKTIGVNDGGGTIRNSEGGVDEAGCFRRPARWCDYSGPIAPERIEGITILDHPSNPHHPVPFHVRNDGWMGAALTFGGALELRPGEPLRLRYALYVHAGMPPAEVLQERWEAFAKTEFRPFPEKKAK